MLTTYSDKVGGKVIRVTSKPDENTRNTAVDLAIQSRFDTLFEVKPSGESLDITESLKNRKFENLMMFSNESFETY